MFQICTFKQVLETMVDTNDEWITSRTGIKERRILLKGEGKGTSLFSHQSSRRFN
jgi:3-oxoacyl-[acyl-carrier-protein] synthase-3